MAIIQWLQSLRVASDATFRTALQNFHAHLTTLGLVRLTEGTPINTASVNKPTVANAIVGGLAGSDIWRFNDALHDSGFPAYIRFEYWTNGYNTVTATNDSNRLKITFQVGFATDGAGNLSGKVTEKRAVEVVGKHATTDGTSGLTDAFVDATTENYLSGDTSRLTFAHGNNANFTTLNSFKSTETQALPTLFCNPKPSGSPCPANEFINGIFSIERTLDGNGNNTNRGIVVVHLGYSYLGGLSNGMSTTNLNGERYFSQVLPYTGTSRPQYGWDCADNSDRSSSMLDGGKYPFAIYPHLGGERLNPIKGIVGCYDFDYELGLNNVEIYGATRSYRKLAMQNRCVWGRNWDISRLMMLAE